MGLPPQRPKKILVVDDEADLTMLCRLALEYHGFKVDTFTDPQKALSNYEPGCYDLIILDIAMPVMDGFQLYDEIKNKDQKAKVCFLTASELYYEEFRKKGILRDRQKPIYPKTNRKRRVAKRGK